MRAVDMNMNVRVSSYSESWSRSIRMVHPVVADSNAGIFMHNGERARIQDEKTRTRGGRSFFIFPTENLSVIALCTEGYDVNSKVDVDGGEKYV